MVNSQVKQAQYNFVGASEQLESAHRNVVQTVRSSYNNVNASISSINAYKQAVVSAQSSLDANEAGYSVGTRTIVDVLDATTTLYNAKQQLSSARYQYLINQLNIKQALGTLNEQDLQMLNSTLGKPVSTSPDSVAPENPQQDAAVDNFTLTAAPRLRSQRQRVAPHLPAAVRIRSVIRPCPMALSLSGLLNRRPGKHSATRRKITPERKPT